MSNGCVRGRGQSCPFGDVAERCPSGYAGGMSLYAMQKLRNNKKKVVDRRASKGRKIRCAYYVLFLSLSGPFSRSAHGAPLLDYSFHKNRLLQSASRSVDTRFPLSSKLEFIRLLLSHLRSGQRTPTLCNWALRNAAKRCQTPFACLRRLETGSSVFAKQQIQSCPGSFAVLRMFFTRLLIVLLSR